MSRKKFNILLLSSGGPGAKGVIDSFKNSNLEDFDFRFFGLDANKDAINQDRLDKFYVSPKRKERKCFLSFLKKVFLEENIDLIYPLSSDDITLLLSSTSCLDDNIKRSILLFENNYEILTDKFLTYSLAKDKSYCPKFFTIKKEKYREIFSEGMEEDLYVKPRKGSGARANFFLKKEVKLSDFLSKKGSNVIDYETFFNLSSDLDEFVFCEFLPGEEYSVDVFSEKGEILNTCIRLRKEVKSGVSSVAIVKNSEEVVQILDQVVRDFDLDGASNIQLKRNINGKLKLVEINPRTSGTICVSFNAGVNIVELAFRKHIGLEFKNIYPFLSKEVKMIRHSEETYLYD